MVTLSIIGALATVFALPIIDIAICIAIIALMVKLCMFIFKRR